MEHKNTSSKSLAQRIDAINVEADLLTYRDFDEAMRLYEESYQLSQSGEFSQEPYLNGLTESLAGQALAYLECCPSQAIRLCQEVLNLLENKPPNSALALVQFTMGAICQQEQKYTLALDWELKALKTSRELKLPLREAMILDEIGLIYGDLGDNEKALAEMQSALDLVRTGPQAYFAPSILNNMAVIYLQSGDQKLALELALRALNLNTELNMENRETFLIDTVGQILLSMKEYERAKALFLDSLQKCQRPSRTMAKIFLKMNLGRIYLAQDDYLKAREEIDQALKFAADFGLQREQAKCYLLLSEIEEKTGAMELAFQYYKKYSEIENSITHEDRTRQIAALNALQDFETARRDAEIYKLRNIDLLHEIEERKRLESRLLELATTDDLTGISNRRSFLDKAQVELNRAARYHRPLSLLMIDVDHFKKVNDSFGHDIGDQVLSGLCSVLRTVIRDSDILARYGGEEFCVLLPDTNADQAYMAAERLRKRVELSCYETTAGSLSITVSIGCVNFELNAEKRSSLEALISEADHALYKAKQAGRNRVETNSAQAA
jgi:diguanylate cyclase (GGDEF)-like protein